MAMSNSGSLIRPPEFNMQISSRKTLDSTAPVLTFDIHLDFHKMKFSCFLDMRFNVQSKRYNICQGSA